LSSHTIEDIKTRKLTPQIISTLVHAKDNEIVKIQESKRSSVVSSELEQESKETPMLAEQSGQHLNKIVIHH
jgi:hypothetical protein